MSAPARWEVDESTLHASLTDPAFGSVAFFNEIMARYPDAVSFAPGAPSAAHLDDLDVTRYLRRYLDHLTTDRGLTPVRARRLLHEYGPSRGLVNDLVAAALRTDLGIDVPDEAVVVTVGAQEAMLLALRVLHRSARDVLAVVNPCYVGITGAARLLDLDIVPVGERGAGVDLDQLADACRAARAGGGRVRTLYVAPDFANPSGTRLDLAARERLLAVAEQQDIVVLEDLAYGFTAAPEHALPTLKSLDRTGRVVAVGTFAKVCLPGARVGFAVADQTVRGRAGTRLLAADLAAAKGMTTVNTSPVAQAVIGGMLLAHGGSLTALGREKASLYRRNLALLLDELDQNMPVAAGVRWNHPAGGFFVRLTVPVRADFELLEESAARYGVLWTPMSVFHLDGGGRDEIRLACSYLDAAGIREGVARLAKFVRDRL